MIFKDYYRILELEDNKVTAEQIRVKYRELAKKYHPDVNVGNEIAEERFKDVSEAYRVLTNSSAKRKYDRMWNTHVGKKKNRPSYEESPRSADSLVSDFFNLFFGNIKEKKEDKEETKTKKRIPVNGENIETEINVSIDDAFYGKEKKISLRTIEGKMKTFTVKVPAGIRDKEKIRLIGQGKSGKNGGKNGDLFIKINIDDNEKFKLKGYDLYSSLYLTPWEALFGTRINVDGIDETVSLYIPPSIQSGEKIRIPQKGYKDGQGSRGNLVVDVKIMVPKKPTEQEKELFKKIEEVSNFNPRIQSNG